MEAGIDDVGIGVLFGLYDWKFEMLALHAAHPASGGALRRAARTPSACRAWSRRSARHWPSHPPHPVSDVDFQKIVAILRLAVPYTGIIMSTRENADIRRETFALGVSQISPAAARNPGGYADGRTATTSAQFSTGRPPLAGRGGARRRGARLHAVVLHGLLPPRPHRRAISWTWPSPA